MYIYFIYYILIDFSRRLNNLCLIQSKTTTTTTKHKKQARNPRCNTHKHNTYKYIKFR